MVLATSRTIFPEIVVFISQLLLLVVPGFLVIISAFFGMCFFDHSSLLPLPVTHALSCREPFLA